MGYVVGALERRLNYYDMVVETENAEALRPPVLQVPDDPEEIPTT